MEEKRGRRERKAQGYTRSKKPTESKMKEREVRVGGRQGKTGEEKEATKMKAWERETEGGETARWSSGETEQNAKQINNQLTGITK